MGLSKSSLEYRQKGKLKNINLILPNIELRLDILSGKPSKRLNFHIIFSEEIDPEDIEEHFLHSLEFKTGSNENKRLTKGNIERLGQKLKIENPNFKGTDFQVGCKNITINIDQIQEILDKSRSIFDGKYIFVLSAREWDDIGWDGQGHIEKQHPFFISHAIFSANQRTRDFCLGKRYEDSECFLKEFGSFKPCIHGSDAHSFDDLCKPDKDRYCWIKAMPTFDGLRQILFEPQDRVKIQKENPENYKNIYSLNSIEFYDSIITDEISIPPQIIPFNKNFVAITGGKGSGKTAILDLIANCYVDRCHRIEEGKLIGEDKNSFVQRIQYETDKLGVKINFIEESIEPFSKKILESVFIQKSPITYLPQGKIEEISGDKVKLSEKIEEIVFNNENVKKEGYKERFIEIKENTITISKQLNEYNIAISKLEEETSEQILAGLNSEKEIAEGKITDKKIQIQKIEANLEEGIQDRILNFKKDIKENKTESKKYSEIINQINFLLTDIQNYVISSNLKIRNINEKIDKLEIEFKIPETNANDQIQNIKNIDETINKIISEKSEALLLLEQSLHELSGEEKIHTKLLRETEIIEDQIQKIEQSLKNLDEKKEEISCIEIKRTDKFEEMLVAFSEWEQYYDEVIEAFSLGKGEILGDIQFKSKIIFDYDKFTLLAYDIFNKNRISKEDISVYTSDLRKELENYFKQKNKYINIKEVLDNILNNKDLIKKTRSKKEFYDWLFGNYFSLNTEIEFKGKSIDKLSMGQKGTVLLKLFLAEGDYPIILDQPEENLDNKFIYDELVGAMRKAKNNRQVLIATNNANLVVNTDAEQIIIAEFNDGRISYKTGALERPDIRQEIMPLLEGGQEAFKKREEKYGIMGYKI